MHARPYQVPLEGIGPDDPTGADPPQWLTHHMARQGLSDAGLLKKLQMLGYPAESRVNVAKWRKGKTPIPPEVFYKICLALGMPNDQAMRLACEVLKEAYPEIAPFIRDPGKELGERVLAYLKGANQHQKRVTNVEENGPAGQD